MLLHALIHVQPYSRSRVDCMYSFSASNYDSDGLGDASASTWSSYNGDWSNGAISVNTDLNDFQYTACEPNSDTNSVTVNFICNKGDDTLSIVTEPEPSGFGACVFVFQVDSSIVCAGGSGGGGGDGGKASKKGLSGGWIFVIILLVAFSVYFIVGILFNRCRGGKTGTEMVPNIAFWRDLPSLVKDGCSYSLAKSKGLCGIKSVESTAAYSTV